GRGGWVRVEGGPTGWNWARGPGGGHARQLPPTHALLLERCQLRVMVAAAPGRLTAPRRHAGLLQAVHRLIGLLRLRPAAKQGIEGILERAVSKPVGYRTYSASFDGPLFHLLSLLQVWSPVTQEAIYGAGACP